MVDIAQITECSGLLEDGISERMQVPWRAQPLGSGTVPGGNVVNERDARRERMSRGVL